MSMHCLSSAGGNAYLETELGNLDPATAHEALDLVSVVLVVLPPLGVDLGHKGARLAELVPTMGG